MQRFKNKDQSKKLKGFCDFLKWRWHAKKISWPPYVPLNKMDTPPSIVLGHNIRISYVGHVTFLIQTAGVNILTDPVWSERASPFSKLGPKRVTPPAIHFDHLPKIDLIIISHNHYDHLDMPTISRLWERDKSKLITPLKNEEIIKSTLKDINIETLGWHESCQFNDNIEICLEPAQHWSRRGFFDLNRALWGTFIIQTPLGPICFIGDSGYDPLIFKQIFEKFGKMLVSLIPIGAFEPRWFMEYVHMNPEEAVKVHLDLKSQYSIASHFETFPLAEDEFDQARLELEIAKEKYKIETNQFIAPQIGDVFLFNKSENMVTCSALLEENARDNQKTIPIKEVHSKSL